MTRLLDYHERNEIFAGAAGWEFFATNQCGFVRLSVGIMSDQVDACYGRSFARFVFSFCTTWRCCHQNEVNALMGSIDDMQYFGVVSD